MKFDNLQAELTLNDKLDLLSVQLELSFYGENQELSSMFLKAFPGNKVISNISNENQYFVKAKVPLTDAGKNSIKSIVSDLKDLDNKFGERTALVDDFSKLLGE